MAQAFVCLGKGSGRLAVDRHGGCHSHQLLLSTKMVQFSFSRSLKIRHSSAAAQEKVVQQRNTHG